MIFNQPSDKTRLCFLAVGASKSLHISSMCSLRIWRSFVMVENSFKVKEWKRMWESMKQHYKKTLTVSSVRIYQFIMFPEILLQEDIAPVLVGWEHWLALWIEVEILDLGQAIPSSSRNCLHTPTTRGQALWCTRRNQNPLHQHRPDDGSEDFIHTSKGIVGIWYLPLTWSPDPPFICVHLCCTSSLSSASCGCTEVVWC